MRVYVCDDIEEYRNSIKSYVSQYFIEKKMNCKLFEYNSPVELLGSGEVANNSIFFIDIEYPNMQENGIELIRKLKKICPSSFYVVVTAYNQYLDDAMDLNVLRYVEKPIEQKRIYSALDKAICELNNSIIEIKSINGEYYYLNKSDIIYAEAKYKKSFVTTTNGVIEIPVAFKSIKDLLNSSNFIVPHNSYVVNKQFIVYYKRSLLKVIVNNKEITIPVSATKQSEIKKKMHQMY